jgi:hypothetical protein
MRTSLFVFPFAFLIFNFPLDGFGRNLPGLSFIKSMFVTFP